MHGYRITKSKRLRYFITKRRIKSDFIRDKKCRADEEEEYGADEGWEERMAC